MPLLVTRVIIKLEIGYDTLADDSKEWVTRDFCVLYKIGLFKMAKFFYDKIISILTVQDTLHAILEEESYEGELNASQETPAHPEEN